jgi:hypothetical protein
MRRKCCGSRQKQPARGAGCAVAAIRNLAVHAAATLAAVAGLLRLLTGLLLAAALLLLTRLLLAAALLRIARLVRVLIGH